MNKFVYSALALSLVSVPAFGTDNDWAGLDKAIDGLSSSLAADKGTGPKISGWVISSYRHSKNVDVVPDDVTDPSTLGTQEQSGFQLDSVRLIITGDAGNDFSYKVSFDFAASNNGASTDAGHGGSTSISPVIKDAWAKFKIIDQLNGTMGRFKEPLLHSAMVSDNRLMFLDRTFIGEALGRRDLGLMFTGSFDVVDYWFAFQDGNDGQANEHRYTGRITADILGNGTGADVEGGYGAPDEANLTVGVAAQDDTDLDNGLVLAGEVMLTVGPFSVAGEIVNFDDGNKDANGDGDTTDPGEGFGFSVGPNGRDASGTTPWDITVGFLISDQWEVGARYEDLDDDPLPSGGTSTESFSLGVNYYVQGHDIKWQGQIRNVHQVGEDITQYGVGLAVSF